MTDTHGTTPTTVAAARAGLSGILRSFREGPITATPVIIGSHRRPEAVLLPFAQYRALTANPPSASPAVLTALQDRADLIRRLARLNKIERVAVFGSTARQAETESSDIDLLVTPSDDASLFDLAQFEIDMEELTGRAVDVVSIRGLDPTRDSAILAEAIEL
ncbi:nucleotidyltransferase domain-containing protein [Salinibacterium sp. ZJ454]|uniref:nucleotidyltransferase family protein n=1 Tax=Salinibacterium sp. ZJ454 TaxID=2708339 RepID=UPI00142461A7|nr:nucleotidyltransferase domain-containing protein [Salinibacterium sp. ZJ454]